MFRRKLRLPVTVILLLHIFQSIQGDGPKACSSDVLANAPRWARCGPFNSFLAKMDGVVCKATLKLPRDNCLGGKTKGKIDFDAWLSSSRPKTSDDDDYQCKSDDSPIEVQEVGKISPNCYSYIVPICEDSSYELDILTNFNSEIPDYANCYDVQINGEEVSKVTYYNFSESPICPRIQVNMKLTVKNKQTILKNGKELNVAIQDGQFSLDVCFDNCKVSSDGDDDVIKVASVMMTKSVDKTTKPCSVKRTPTTTLPPLPSTSLPSTTTEYFDETTESFEETTEYFEETTEYFEETTEYFEETTESFEETTEYFDETTEYTTEYFSTTSPSTSDEVSDPPPSPTPAPGPPPATDSNCKNYDGDIPSQCWARGCQFYKYLRLGQEQKCASGSMSCEAKSYKKCICSHSYCDKISAAAADCKPDPPIFNNKLSCRRANSYYIYHPKQHCYNENDSGDCDAKVIYAVNVNGIALTDDRGITYIADVLSGYRDPQFTRLPVLICPAIVGVTDHWTKKLYASAAVGKPWLKDAEGKCMTYPVPICQSGEYILSIKMTEDWIDAKNVKCSEVRLNGVPIMLHLDPWTLSKNKKCAAVDAVVMFIAEGGNDNDPTSARVLHLKGHDEPIQVIGGTMELQFCYGYDCCHEPNNPGCPRTSGKRIQGKTGKKPTNSYQASAFSLERLGAGTKPCELKGLLG